MKDLLKIKCLLAHPTATSVREAVLVERMIRMGKRMRSNAKVAARPVSIGFRTVRIELPMPSQN